MQAREAIALYKTELILAYQEARVRSLSADGDVSMGEFLGCVYQTIRRVLEGRPEALARAFDQNGFGAHQSAMRGVLCHRLGLEQPIGVPSTRPTNAVLQRCFPRRLNVSLPLFWSLYDEAAPAVAPAALPAGPARSVAPAMPAVVVAPAAYRAPRTRLMARREAEAAAGAAAGPR